MSVHGGVSAPGGCMVPGRVSAPGRGDGLLPGGAAWWRPPTATAAGGTHPTGMHSLFLLCFYYFSQVKLESGEEIGYDILVLATGTGGPFPSKIKDTTDKAEAVSIYNDMVEKVMSAIDP